MIMIINTKQESIGSSNIGSQKDNDIEYNKFVELALKPNQPIGYRTEDERIKNLEGEI